MQELAQHLTANVWEVAAQRDRLPNPAPLNRGFSIWSVLKSAIGKDLTRITLPATINEPLSALQVGILSWKTLADPKPALLHKQDMALGMLSLLPTSILCGFIFPALPGGKGGGGWYRFSRMSDCNKQCDEGLCLLQRIAEDLEYRTILDKALACQDPGIRALLIAAFVASGYSATLKRESKPFNPLLGETFEWQSEDQTCRFFCEQVTYPVFFPGYTLWTAL